MFAIFVIKFIHNILLINVTVYMHKMTILISKLKLLRSTSFALYDTVISEEHYQLC